MRHALVIVVVALISPFGRTKALHLVLGLIERSGRRDRRSLRLGAKTCKQVRAAGAWGRVVNLILADWVDLRRESHAQPLRIKARAVAKTRTRSTKATGGKTVIVVVRHLS